MAESSQPELGDRDAIGPATVAVPSRSGILLLLNLLFTCVGIAAVIALGIVYWTKPVESDSTAQVNAQNPSHADSPAAEKSAAPKPQTNTTPQSRQPAVSLVATPVPATTEQLRHESEQVAKRLRSQFPELPEALHVVAMMHAQQRQTAEAEKLWRKCIELAPNNEQYYVNLAAVAMDRGNSLLAAETLEKAAASGISSPDLLHHLAVAQMDIGKCEVAEQTIEKALRPNPRFSAGWVVKGQAQLKLGKVVEAEESLRKALALGSQSAEVYFSLANAVARQGKNDEAESLRKKFSELKATQPLDTRQRFQILTAAETRRNAVAVCTEAAMVHSWQGDFLESERLLLRAIALDPANVASCRTLASLYRQANMKPEERVLRRRLAEIEPHEFSNHLSLAKLSAELGELESAEAALKVAISLQPDRLDGYAVLAQLYQQSGRHKQARWFAQEAVNRQPTAEGYRFLATTCEQLGDNPSADAALEMASKLESGSSQPPAKLK